MTAPAGVETSARAGNLERMLEARSVAVVGASPKQGSFGRRMMTELIDGGFAGQIHPVNPNHAHVLGRECVPSLAHLDAPVDLVLLGVPNARLEEQLTAAAHADCSSAVIFASGHDAATGNLDLVDRLRAIALDAGMAVCGCNCMGFVNVHERLRACGYFEPPDLEAGGITFVCHSGSVFSAVLHNRRSMRFNLVVSSGNEMITGLSDYVFYALQQETTRVIGLFIETVRDPQRFEAALAAAAAANVPLVVLKVGRTLRSEALVAAHTGALAGSDGVFEALFDHHGVTRVATLDEMADTLELLAGRPAGPGGLATLHDSGGERALLVDLADDAGVDFAVISETTRSRLANVLEPGLEPDNPLDAWGTGNASDEIFGEAMRALSDDPATAAIAFCVDLTAEDDPSMAYVGMAVDAYRATDKPVAVLGNLTSAIDPDSAKRLRAAGVPVLEGTRTGLDAFGHLFARRDRAQRGPLQASAGLGSGELDRWRARIRGDRIDETLTLALLDAYGIPVVAAFRGRDEATVLAAARAAGYPVALKTAEDHPHKTEVGGVALGIDSQERLRSAYAKMSSRLGPRVTVEAMAGSGMELSLGILRDEDFGPIVMVGAGGVTIEILNERRFAMPPFDAERAKKLVTKLGFMSDISRAPARVPDIDSVARSLARLSLLACDLRDDISALDINPMIVTPSGCVTVDALLIPRSV